MSEPKMLEHECMNCGKVYWHSNVYHYCPNCDSANVREVVTEHDRVEALEHELGALIARYQAVLGENVSQARQLAEHDGHSDPPACEGTRSSGMKLVLTKHIGYRLANYWPELSGWLESWTMHPLDEVVTWWELPGGTK